MRSFSWSEGLSRAYHEAGHALAGYRLGLRVISSTLPAIGGGGETSIDFEGDHRKEVLVAFAGMHCQIHFDQRHSTTVDWDRERYDDSASDRSDAKRTAELLAREPHGTTECDVLLALSYESQILVQANDDWPRIERFANDLYDKHHLDEADISRLFLEDGG